VCVSVFHSAQCWFIPFTGDNLVIQALSARIFIGFSEDRVLIMWAVRAIALLCVYNILGWMGYALEEARGMQAGYLYANHTVKSDLSCSYEATCSSGGYSGVCVSISSGCCGGAVSVWCCSS
jgi:hypothetical protein